jgi:uncharacterized damage-inducible protein DinB
MESTDRLFLAVSAGTLRDNYLPKIKEAVALLSEEELWERESKTTNSVGNLLMHLSGNVRQHILSGVGGRADERDRPKEFAARGGSSKAALLAELETTVLEAYHTIATLDPALLSEERVIQGNKVTLLKDIHHVVEHFAYHTGQIIHIVKAVKQHNFPWYSHLEVSMRI